MRHSVPRRPHFSKAFSPACLSHLLIVPTAPWTFGRSRSVPPRAEESLRLAFDGIEARDHAAGADDVRLDRLPVGEIGGRFDPVADRVRGVEAVFRC